MLFRSKLLLAASADNAMIIANRCFLIICCFRSVCLLEVYRNLHVDLSARKVVRNSILLIGNVSNPVVGVNVVYAQEVQTLGAHPKVTDRVALVVSVVIVDDAIV